MDKFIGKWKLETNENFDKFLKYYKYNWFKIQAALISNIDLDIVKLDDNKYNRIINSTFMTAEEIYYIDNTFHANMEEVKKKHRQEGDILVTKAEFKDISWDETTQLTDSKLVIERCWTEGSTTLTCKQIFVKSN